jgi:hypothetical protein
MAAGGLARIALAGCLLALAALLVTATGGAGLRGALGSLFGLHAGHAGHATAGRRSQPGGGAEAQSIRLPPTAHVQARAPAARHRARGHRRRGAPETQAPSRTPAQPLPP